MAISTLSKKQNRNRRNNRMLSFDGQTKCLAEWAEVLGLNERMVRSRLYSGWSVDRALTKRAA